MRSSFIRTVLCAAVVASFVPRDVAAAGADADDVLVRVRARNEVRCAGIVRPGYAVPTVDGKRWYGLSTDICRAVAAAVLGDRSRISFRPYFSDGLVGPAYDGSADIVFLSAAEIVGSGTAPAQSLVLGPTIAHDSSALLVPSASNVAHAGDLGSKTICVEPGSPADRALEQYFSRHGIALHEHPFQETDEMRQAYGDGKCDALAGPLSTLASVRADPHEGHASDRILPEMLSDDPIVAATASDARWSRIVWWTFSALVDAELAGIRSSNARDSIDGVPPAIGAELTLAPSWERATLAGGNYAEIFDRNLGRSSSFALARDRNKLWNDGGLIYGLFSQ